MRSRYLHNYINWQRSGMLRFCATCEKRNLGSNWTPLMYLSVKVWSLKGKRLREIKDKIGKIL